MRCLPVVVSACLYGWWLQSVQCLRLLVVQSNPIRLCRLLQRRLLVASCSAFLYAQGLGQRQVRVDLSITEAPGALPLPEQCYANARPRCGAAWRPSRRDRNQRPVASWRARGAVAGRRPPAAAAFLEVQCVAGGGTVASSDGTASLSVIFCDVLGPGTACYLLSIRFGIPDRHTLSLTHRKETLRCVSRTYGGVAFACARFARQVAPASPPCPARARSGDDDDDSTAGGHGGGVRAATGSPAATDVWGGECQWHGGGADMESTAPMSSARHLAGVASREASPPVV